MGGRHHRTDREAAPPRLVQATTSAARVLQAALCGGAQLGHLDTRYVRNQGTRVLPDASPWLAVEMTRCH